MKVCSEEKPRKRRGRPVEGKHNKPYLNGWYMNCDPRSGRILSVELMYEPENTEVKIKSIEKIINLYPNFDTYIHDISCKLAPSLEKNDVFPQIKNYAVDKFHAKKHTKHCRYSPYNVKSLEERLHGINTNMAE